MDTISVRNLEKYQPNYKDGRKLLWIRWDISALGDYKIVNLPPEARWLFLVLICLGSESENNIPLDLKWLKHKSGIDTKHISKLLLMLQNIGLVVTDCDKMSQDVTDCDKMSPTYIHTDKTYKTYKTDNTPLILEIISDLNSVLGTKYRNDSKETVKLISKLLETYTVEDFKIVHRKKFNDWADDKEMSKYLRPSTLYGSKFEAYLNQKEVNLNHKDNQEKSILDEVIAEEEAKCKK